MLCCIVMCSKCCCNCLLSCLGNREVWFLLFLLLWIEICFLVKFKFFIFKVIYLCMCNLVLYISLVIKCVVFFMCENICWIFLILRIMGMCWWFCICFSLVSWVSGFFRMDLYRKMSVFKVWVWVEVEILCLIVRWFRNSLIVWILRVSGCCLLWKKMNWCV